MSREVMRYIGDGIRAPEHGELVGNSVNIEGRRGKVVENDHFTITVEWEKPPVPTPLWTHIKEAFRFR